VSIRRHIRTTLAAVDNRLGLREWLRQDDNGESAAEERARRLRAADPFASSTELRHPAPRTVIDIGGSHGQFAKEIFRLFPGATVYSFEPIPECYEELLALSQTHPELHAMQLALSDHEGKRDFHVSRFRDSSSFQEMLPAHLEAWPHTGLETRITVEMARLDTVAQGLTLKPPVLAKLDIQGHELAAIEGGRETLSRCQRVMVECNFKPLYEGQPSFTELDEAMRSLGFLLDGFVGFLRHPRTQELLSADVIFYKPSDAVAAEAGVEETR
jgi:FkbM family methyltransferase